MLNPTYESFVGFVRTPVVYGMTPAEMALWLKKDLRLDVDVRAAPMAGYRRGSQPKRTWIPPSPAIRSWDCGLCFPITVFLEALPALDHGRGTATPFQRVGAPWLDAKTLSRELNALKLPGIRFAACGYRAMSGSYSGHNVRGLKIQVADASEYLPVQAGLAILRLVQDIHGANRLWSHPGTRESFFDQLMGTDTVRRALIDGRSLVEITPPWALQSADFWQSRKLCLRY
jgi:beta-N-acetylhexosaminidase